ncbi:PAS/PAC sensor signal transduction histidine kinase [Halorubrum coriense DSM 10284]|uniref:histidine kinase n=1 Tax=Halorubrum coriense DSM 10284 TaxID=1227466 RepID=M0ERX6_9EURY|nr:ATP-binding protein [Halorubrum coriense]ELZ50450.1 PAS/PAC sensor signal transduction histidine kinase [Halorubrum coriense DSM 10284]
MDDRNPDRRARDLSRYETILGSLDDAVYAIRSDGTVAYVNERYAEMKGVDRDKFLGTGTYDWGSEETARLARREHTEMWEAAHNTGVVEYEFEPIDGEPFPAEMRFGPTDLGDGEELGRVGVIRDISERKYRERELQRQNERLDEFASIVSHDLRNPLDVAQGYLGLAREEHDSPHLEAVAKAHDRMGTLIDDLLTLAREGVDVESLEPVALGAVTEECWQGVETADTTLRAEATATIRADRSRLKQLLENLLRNAVSHGGPAVTITVGDLDSGFYVADNGPGIPEDERNEVFGRDHTANPEGAGLGLAIVERVAEAHGWAVGVTDGPDGGARFEFTGVDVE